MTFRRHRDDKVEQLSHLTGIRRRDRLIELGRLVDIVETSGDELSEWTGAAHAVAVLRGSCVARSTRYAVGDVFVTRPFERVTADDAVVLLAPAAAADALTQLSPAAARGTRRWSASTLPRTARPAPTPTPASRA